MKNYRQRSPSLSRRGRSTSHLNSSNSDRRRLGFELLEDRRLLAVLSVDNLNDSGPGSLREAITIANTNGEADTIDFSVAGTIELTSGELPVTDDLTVSGPSAAALTIDAFDNSRVFHSTSGDLTLQGLTLSNGSVAGPNDGGAVRFAGGGRLTVDGVVIKESLANAGGAIAVSGSNFDIKNSALIDNEANFAGSAFFAFGSSVGTLRNSTISGNTSGSNTGAVQIQSSSSALLEIQNSTIANNTGDGIHAFGYSGGNPGISIKNSILSGNSDLNATILSTGSIISDGHNISDDSSAGFTAIGDQTSIDPLIGPLAFNGGPTQTHALLPDSPAINAGAPSILSTSFSAAEGHVNGNLGFQEPNGVGNGKWLGQPFAQVNATAGTVTSVGGPFDRNMWDVGANGGTGGVPSTAGFTAGDVLTIEFDYQFTLDADDNRNLLAVGFRDEGPNVGNNFDASPQQGFNAQFREFNDAVQFFPNMNDEVNPLEVDGSLLGLDFGCSDFTSDDLRFAYQVATDGAGNWTVQQFSVTNLMTSVEHVYSGPEQSFTYAAADAFFSQQLVSNGDTTSASGTNISASALAARFDYLPGVFDQRGAPFARVVHNRIDIGAFESTALPNPGFEADGGSLRGWTAINSAVLTMDQNFEGTHSAKLSGDGSGFSVLFQGVSVEAGEEITASVQSLVESSNLPAGEFGELKFEFYSTFGDDFSNRITAGDTSVITADDGTVPNQWNQTTLNAIAPAGAVEARIVLTYVGTDTGRSIFYDAVDFAINQTFTVDTAADENDGDYSAGDLSLREAIGLANGTAGADTITFSTLFITQQTIDLDSQLIITDELTITGPGASLLTVDAGLGGDGLMNGNGYRIFNIDDGSTSNQINVELSGLTLTGGDPNASDQGGNGGAIRNVENVTLTEIVLTDNSAEIGGAIDNSSVGTVNVNRSTLSGNSSVQRGGGISSAGTVNVASSTISGNNARTGFAFANGGGIWNDGTLNVTNSTISGNNASFGGGGIHNDSNGTANVTNSTISGNDAVIGGGIYIGYSTANVTSSIVAGNTISSYDNIFGSLNTNTNNLLSGDPMLGPLEDNGGPTKTHALLPGSPAFNAGDPTIAFDAAEFDQRGSGFARVQFGRVDIGAYESETLDPRLFVVTTTNDELDFSNADVSLREAITVANTVAGANTITFSSLFDTQQTIAIDNQLPTITDEATITGPGANLLTLDAGNGTDDIFGTGDGYRIFNIDDGDNSNQINVALNGITLTGGDLVVGNGGAIFNLENVTITSTTISGNFTDRFGGGLAGPGTHHVINSTISANESGLNGGGIANGGSLNLTSSTISGNDANFGGGISNGSTSTINITSSTVTGNSASYDGGGILSAGFVNITNSIVAGNTAPADPNVAGSLTTDTFNLLSGDPMLGPLADNGGPTQTHALLHGSPAIDAGNTTVLTDQRGLPRPVDLAGLPNAGNGTDIGAYEVQDNVPPTVTVNVLSTTDTTPQLTGTIDDPDATISVTVDGQIVSATNHMDGSWTLTDDTLIALAGATYNVVVTATDPFGNVGTDMTNGELTILVLPTVDVDLLATNDSTPLISGTVNDSNATVSVDVGPQTGLAATVLGDGSWSVQLGTPLSPGIYDVVATVTNSAGATVDSSIDELTIAPAQLIVSTLVDELDSDFSSGDFSLREAINLANNIAGADTIAFDPTLFSAAQTILIDSQLPTVSDDLTITGTGANLLTIDANYGGDGMQDGAGYRVLNIDDGDGSNTISVELSDLKITGGDIGGGSNGGGIASQESLTLNRVSIEDNHTVGGYGGGLYVGDGDVSINGSTFNGNSAQEGGGINQVLGTTTINNSTVSDNYGGGLFVADGSLSVTSSTITDNGRVAGSSNAGGIHVLAGSATLTNSIVAGNQIDGSASNLGGGVTFSGDFNLLGTGTTTGGASDITGVDAPLLGGLADNGGPTLTHALQSGSQAINAGDPAFDDVATPFDQRGSSRVSDGRVDIGAFELQVALVDSADFDTDGDIDGADFLAWQRGFGTSMPATNADGDADNDLDVDAADLGIWQTQYGQPAPLAFSEHSAVESPEVPGLAASSAALIDAAMAWQWANESTGGESPLVDLQPQLTLATNPVAVASSPLAAQQSTGNDDTLAPVDGEQDTDETPWLDEALLDRVFG